ncbi:hypothetical protein JTB14_009436 [Gonioctena quinquepunctata]|nr:hypothetical protein JTB14_009436 [Gonioctena quinquepunctata]
MSFKNVLVIITIVLSYSSEAAWLSDMISPRGWQFGDGMIFHLQDTKVENNSLFDRIAMRIDYGNVSVSATQKPERDAVDSIFTSRIEKKAEVRRWVK